MTTPVAPTPAPEDIAIGQIDFAMVVDRQLLVYGWIWDLAGSVDHASIYLGDVVIDLTAQAIRVRRPDVAKHFSVGITHDEHGFFALIDLPANFVVVDHLRLCFTLRSGRTDESRWPVACHNPLTAAELQPYVTTLNGLLRRLPKQEGRRLIRFAASALPLLMPGPALPQTVRFEIDLCCLLENRILVIVGWILDPAKELTRAQLHLGGTVFDFLKSSARIARPDLAADLSRFQGADDTGLPGFMFVQTIPPGTEIYDARFAITAGADTVHMSRLVSCIPHEARRDFLSFVGKLDPDPALVLNERVAAVLDKNSPPQRALFALLDLNHHSTVERLPTLIEHSNPRYSLFVDQAIPVAEKGIFLVGWFSAEPAAQMQVVCHCGLSSFVVSDHWVRHARTDVTSNLVADGQPTDHKHGFSCYVPLRHGAARYYLSVGSELSETHRIRLPVSQPAESALQTVRALLTSFDSEHPDRRSLMDRHIAPAVGAAWAARRQGTAGSVVRSYGTAPASPEVSIIVPWFGQYDLAEYQMALFGDDPELQTFELIYVVDDPSIFDAFANVCPDLYGIYRVPFVLAFSGTNLGLAGANNFGAGLARGKYLQFLHSDVLPKRHGWIGDLLRIYKSLHEPGLLSAKLLHEDGTIQHAGMAFRRSSAFGGYSAWGDLWVKEYPLQGRSPLGLGGVREADAVTGACALIEAELYRALGGFSEDYIVGGYEDSDLCLRANSAGRHSYVALDIELYHLEHQSRNRMGDVRLRTNLTAYNCWLHDSRWAAVMEKISQGEHAELPASGA